MKTGAELEAPAESSEAVDKKEKETEVRKQAAASRPRFRGEIQYEQLEQQRAAAESAPGSTVRILRTGGRGTAVEQENYRRYGESAGEGRGRSGQTAGESQAIRRVQTQPSSSPQGVRRVQTQPSSSPQGVRRVQTQPSSSPQGVRRVQTQPSSSSQSVRRVQQQGELSRPVRQTQSGQPSGGSRPVRREQPSGRNQAARSRAAGERPRFHPGGEQQEYNKNRARAAAVRRKRNRKRRACFGAGLLILVLAVGGAGFGLVRWKEVSKRRELAEQGVVAMEAGDYEAAIAVFDQALEGAGKRIGGFEEDVLFNRAEAEYRQGDFGAALSTYQLLLKKDSDNEMARQGAALCLAETGEWEQALALGVLQSQIYSRMAAAQIEAGQYEEAMQTISKGRSLPDQSAARNLDFNEAVIYEKQGDFAQALQLFEAYQEKYGADEAVEREIVFLKSRQGGQ